MNKIIQNRKLEKSFVNKLGISTTEWAFIEKADDINNHSNLLPGILKTNTLGYDGHGQFVLNSLEDIKKVNIFSRLMKSLNYLIWGDV